MALMKRYIWINDDPSESPSSEAEDGSTHQMSSESSSHSAPYLQVPHLVNFFPVSTPDASYSAGRQGIGDLGLRLWLSGFWLSFFFLCGGACKTWGWSKVIWRVHSFAVPVPCYQSSFQTDFCSLWPRKNAPRPNTHVILSLLIQVSFVPGPLSFPSVPSPLLSSNDIPTPTIPV